MSRYQLVTGADDDIGRWVCARTGDEWIDGMGRAIGFTRSKMLIAGLTYVMYNGVNVWMAIASEDPGWMNRANLWAIFDYPFRQLGVKRISVLINASNARSIRFVERLGLSLEATLDHSAPDGGHQLVYRLKAEECRWLTNLRYRRDEQGRRSPAARPGLPGPRAAAGRTQH